MTSHARLVPARDRLLATGLFALLAGSLVACGGRLASGYSDEAPSAATTSGGRAIAAGASWDAVATWEANLAYPPSPKGAIVDVHHGVEVPDPYRWLEDPDSDATAAWVELQNEITFGLLDTIPTRAELRDRLEELWDYERFGSPTLRGDRVFYSKNDGLQNQSVLYVADGLDAALADEGRVLLDPNTFSEDGTIALAGTNPSPNGRILAYATSDGGSDWRTWRFLEVDTGRHLDDVITRNKFGGIDWVDGGGAVLYARFERATGSAELTQRNRPADICVHVMGTDEAQDVVLRAAPEDGRSAFASVSNSRRAAVGSVSETATRNNEIEVLSLVGDSFGRGVKLIEGFDAQFRTVGNLGDRFWIQTNLDAPNWRVIEVDLKDRDRDAWKTVIPEAPEAMQGVSAVGGHLVASYLKDASSEIRVFDLDGTLVRTVDLPGIGSARGFGGELDQDVTFFRFTSFTTPPEIWSYHVPTGRTELFRRPTVDFDPAGFEVSQVFYESKDGTQVPMFLVHKPGIALDGSNPTLLYGYGGFNVSLTPSFGVSNLVWVERGGVYAMPNLRGGGEYGEDWHAAGTKTRKQNVFDDFIAAAEWLVGNGYTSPEHLAISGGSNGGLLVGACMIQRPDLFGACLPAVGVMDMLRYHLFTIGWAWAGDYGNVDVAEEFAALYAYSPYHNLEDGVAYPPTLVTTAARDDRVVPAHSFKFAARLQEAHAGPAPTLIRVETRAGHGAGKPTSMRIDEAADVLAFLEYALLHRAPVE